MKSKTEIRKALKIAVAEMSVDQKQAESARLCERLLTDPSIRAAHRLGVYLPLPDEPDLRPALTVLMNAGCQLALPFLEKPETASRWRFHLIDRLTGPVMAPWGLEHPPAGDRIEVRELDAVLVPGRGFTAEGQRIGRGKGIYDRLLENASVRSIGIGFSCQLTASLPTEPHDIALSEIWTG